jgi:hypothetical protein
MLCRRVNPRFASCLNTACAPRTVPHDAWQGPPQWAAPDQHRGFDPTCMPKEIGKVDCTAQRTKQERQQRWCLGNLSLLAGMFHGPALAPHVPIIRSERQQASTRSATAPVAIPLRANWHLQVAASRSPHSRPQCHDELLLPLTLAFFARLRLAA